MDYNKNGWPAFPGTTPPEHWGDPSRGMTLRDYFAAKAMAAIIANDTYCESLIAQQKSISEQAYWHADGMLAAREVQP